MKKKTTTRADLQRQIVELQAQLVHNAHFADATINKAGCAHMMGSGVIITLTALGGREIIKPIMIRDGLSDATIEALRADFRRTYEAATTYKPKGV